jgi:hypothetical protein
VPLSYRCEDLVYKYGENLFLLVVFQNFVGAWAPTSHNLASPLGGRAVASGWGRRKRGPAVEGGCGLQVHAVLCGATEPLNSGAQKAVA